ncbi:MAG: hypothetical protein ACK5RG_03265 [Cyclobacteriaceae bacterium]|jgi:hypothetical protein|nr:hypothetical protein [Flammeovirgaceae bacterium]
MKTKTKTLLFVGVIMSFLSYGQDDKIINKIDKQIKDINSQSFKVNLITNKDDLLLLSKTDKCVSLIMCTEKDNGKDIMIFNFGDTTRVETYYNLKDGLIGLEEEIITFGAKSTSLKYYFDAGQLYKAIDGKGRNKTTEVNTKELYDRIKRYYHEGWIIK